MNNKKVWVPLALSAALALPACVQATENGVDNIGPGADGFFVAPLDVDSLPDNLFAVDVYYNHYHSTHFGDLPGFKVTSSTTVPRIDYLSGLRLFGGRVGAYANLPLMKQSVAIDGYALSDSQSGQGDATLAPVILWSHGKHFTAGAALEITLPTGKYDPARLANTSNNFRTYKPVFPLTWQPDDNTELSAKFSYSFNMTNSDTGYRSGRIAHVDYSLSYRVAGTLRLGVNGYYLHQTTDDTQDGAVVGDGNRGRAAAAGPALYFNFLKYGSAELRWEHEYSVKNRPQGNNIWVKLSVPFML